MDTGRLDTSANANDTEKSTMSEDMTARTTIYSIFGLRSSAVDQSHDEATLSAVLAKDSKQRTGAPPRSSTEARYCTATESTAAKNLALKEETNAEDLECLGIASPASNIDRAAPREKSLGQPSPSRWPQPAPSDESKALRRTAPLEESPKTWPGEKPQLNLDRSELWKLRKVFDAHDPQHRGLGLDEFYQLVHEYFPEATWNDVAFIFRLFDVEQNGRLSLRDFMCGYAIICHASDEDRLRLCFAMVDRDGSGWLDERQVAQALHLLSNYADLLAQFSLGRHHGHDNDHAVRTDDVLDMARSVVHCAMERRAPPSFPEENDREKTRESVLSATDLYVEHHARSISFEEFLEGALQSRRIQHWLEDIAHVVGDEQPSLRDQKEVEMIALEIERLGLIQTETNLGGANPISESLRSFSDNSTASPAPVSRSVSSSLEESIAHNHDVALATRRGRSRESSQRGGTLYLSQSFSNVPLLEQLAQRQAHCRRTPEPSETPGRASTPKPRQDERVQILAFPSPRRKEPGAALKAQSPMAKKGQHATAGAAFELEAVLDGSKAPDDKADETRPTQRQRRQQYETDLSREMSSEALAKTPSTADPATEAKMASLRMHSPFVIEYSALKFERKIGEGSFSEVWSGEWLHLPVAIKVFKRFDPGTTGSWSMLNPDATDQPQASPIAGPMTSPAMVETTRPSLRDAGVATSASSDTDSASSVNEMTFETAADDNSLIAGIDEDALAGVPTDALYATKTGEALIPRKRGQQRSCMPLLDENPQQLDRFNLVSFVREVELLSQLRHPNVLLYMGATANPRQPLCIISELFPGGSVHDLLFKRHKRLSKRQKFRIAISVARGMLYLHSSKPQILHRDLKSSNVLVDESLNRIAICDFGLSALRKAGPGESGSYGRPPNADALGTPYTLAPEVMAGEPYSDKADVYSYGIVLWELLAAKRPFENLMPIQLMYKVYAQNARPPLGEIYTEFQPLLSQCWERDPLQRPDFGTILDMLEDIGAATNLEESSDGDDEHTRSLQSRQIRLMHAVAQNDLETVTSLLSDGVSPQFCDYDHRTPLHIAAAEGYVDIAERLLQYGAAVNARDRWGSTPLSEAIRFRHEHCVEILRDKYGGRIFDRKSHFELIDAVARGDIAAVRSFIQEGVDVCQADYDQRTALHLAAAEGYTQVAQLLVEAGADILATDRWGSTPLQEAIRFKHPETAVYLEAVMGAQLRHRARLSMREQTSASTPASLPDAVRRASTSELGGIIREHSSPTSTLSPNIDYYGD